MQIRPALILDGKFAASVESCQEKIGKLSGKNFSFLFYRRGQPVRVVAHDSVNTRCHQHAHVRGMIHRPAHHLQIFFLGGRNHRWRHEIAAHNQLPRSNFYGFFDRVLELSPLPDYSYEPVPTLDLSRPRTLPVKLIPAKT